MCWGNSVEYTCFCYYYTLILLFKVFFLVFRKILHCVTKPIYFLFTSLCILPGVQTVYFFLQERYINGHMHAILVY